MAQCNQHRERTAQVLGISVRTLRYKMNRYSLQYPSPLSRARDHTQSRCPSMVDPVRPGHRLPGSVFSAIPRGLPLEPGHWFG